MSRRTPLTRVGCSIRPTDRLLRACASFGIAVHRDTNGHGAGAHSAARRLDRALHRARVTLVIGPSGSGKTTLLRALRHRMRVSHRKVVVPTHTESRRCIIDLIRAPIPRAMRILSAAGLADAKLLARIPSELSAGERARFSLAQAMSRCEAAAEKSPRSPVTLLIDEFGNALDRPAAHTLARTLRRWLSRHIATRTIRVVCATSHDDMLHALEPELVVWMELGSGSRFTRGEMTIPK